MRPGTGIDIRDEVLWFDPCLPDALSEIQFRIRFRAHWVRVRVTRDKLVITVERSGLHPAQIGVFGRVYDFAEGDEREFALHDGARK